MALHEYEQLLMQITFKFDPEDSQFSHPTIVRIPVLLGSYYMYWSYYTYCLIFFLIESIISTERSQ